MADKRKFPRLALPGCLLSGVIVLGTTVLVLWLLLAQPSLQSSNRSELSVSAADLEKHVRMLAEEFAPRSGVHFKNINRTADYIKSEFESIGKGEVSEQWFQVGNYRYRNVSLLFGEKEGERIVVGAHYDGFAQFPAADDNASGVAGVIELARLIAANPINTAIELVAYPLEEPPYYGTSQMGSWKHANRFGKSAEKCKYMVSLEMIGYFSNEPGSQGYPLPLLRLFYPNKGDFIIVAGNTTNRRLIKGFKIGMKHTTDLPVYSICAPESIPGIDFSDHRNYWKAGIPAIMVTDTAFYRNRAYHTARDTADRLDYQKMAMVVVSVYESIRRLEQP